MNILLLSLLALVTVAITVPADDFKIPDGDYIKQKLQEYNKRMNAGVHKKHGVPNRKLYEPEPTTQSSSDRNEASTEAHEMSITEINMNAPMAGSLYQGDILLTKEQADLFLLDDNDRQKRQAAVPKYSVQLWPRNISYTFDPGFAQSYKKYVHYAADLYSKLTCLKFTENAPARTVMYFDHYNGCFTYLGMGNESQHLVSLGPNCDKSGIAIHEIGHALGLFHTQARHDRDDYVSVLFENILDDWTAQFGKQTPSTNDNLGLPYDYGSVMHYDQTSPKNAPKIALIAKDKLAQYNMGSYLDSFYDILMINKLYKCTDDCAGSSTACANSGYPNPNNCSVCICPSGYGGRLCDEMPEGATEIILIPGNKTCQTGQNYSVVPDNANYRKQYFWIRAPENMIVKITYNYMKSNYIICNDGCKWVGMEIKVHEDKAMTGYRFCCSEETVVISNSSLVPIIVYNIEFMKLEYGFCAEIVEQASPVTTTSVPTTTQFITTTTQPTTTTTQPTTTTWPSITSTTTLPPTTTTTSTRQPSTTSTTTTLPTTSTPNEVSCWSERLIQTMDNNIYSSYEDGTVESADPPGISGIVDIYIGCYNGTISVLKCRVSLINTNPKAENCTDIVRCTNNGLVESSFVTTTVPSTTTTWLPTTSSTTLPPTTTSTTTRQPSTTSTTTPPSASTPNDGSCWSKHLNRTMDNKTWKTYQAEDDVQSADPPGLSANVLISIECYNGIISVLKCRIRSLPSIEIDFTVDWMGKTFLCTNDGLVEIPYVSTTTVPSTTTIWLPTTRTTTLPPTTKSTTTRQPSTTSMTTTLPTSTTTELTTTSDAPCTDSKGGKRQLGETWVDVTLLADWTNKNLTITQSIRFECKRWWENGKVTQCSVNVAGSGDLSLGRRFDCSNTGIHWYTEAGVPIFMKTKNMDV